MQFFGLKTIYDLLGGPGWAWKSDFTGARWNFSLTAGETYQDPCINRWQGVNCSKENFLMSLALSNYSLSGKFENNIFQNLTTLTMLDFSDNFIGGSVIYICTVYSVCTV